MLWNDVVVGVALQHEHVNASAFKEGLYKTVVFCTVNVLHGRMSVVAKECHQLGVEAWRLIAQCECMVVAPFHNQFWITLRILHTIGYAGHSPHVLQS